MLLDLVATQADEIARLSAKVVELTGRLADLEQRIGRNPRNSSMPPSKEGLGKPNRLARSERKAAGRRQGKQPGAPGANLAQVVAGRVWKCSDLLAPLLGRETSGFRSSKQQASR